MPAAGKTGTSHDGWFASYLSELMRGLGRFDDARAIDLEGAHSAAPIWAVYEARFGLSRVPRPPSPSGPGRYSFDDHRPRIGDPPTRPAPRRAPRFTCGHRARRRVPAARRGGATANSGWDTTPPPTSSRGRRQYRAGDHRLRGGWTTTCRSGGAASPRGRRRPPRQRRAAPTAPTKDNERRNRRRGFSNGYLVCLNSSNGRPYGYPTSDPYFSQLVRDRSFIRETAPVTPNSMLDGTRGPPQAETRRRFSRDSRRY